MSTIIEVENISKQFIIGHEATERYSTLRDEISTKTKKIFSFSKTEANKKRLPTKEVFFALKDVSFRIEQGDRLGIIGRNGAGKSTLLKILSRITEPSSGRIKIRGRVASLLEVGTGFHPELTGRENIFLNGAILGMSRLEIKRKFDEVVAFAEIEKFLDTPVKRYSSGMYVRLAFAIAAHLEPEILIVDEVLAVGDMEFQKKCIGKMEDVSKNDGRTVIFVSHNMGVIKTLCNNGILLEKGYVSEIGNLDSLVARYLSSANDIKNVEYFHREGGKLLRIKNVNINGGKNASVKMLSEINFQIYFDAIDFRGEAEFYLLIYNNEGTCIQSTFQEDSFSFIKIEEQLGSVNLKIVNTLIPGKYIISVGCFDKRRNFLDWIEFCEGFEVDGVYSDNRIYRKRLGETLINNSEWSLEK
jgi:lipopolysaccharide transport system ATP-binding protein